MGAAAGSVLVCGLLLSLAFFPMGLPLMGWLVRIYVAAASTVLVPLWLACLAIAAVKNERVRFIVASLVTLLGASLATLPPILNSLRSIV
jgi:hypothetical protein